VIRRIIRYVRCKYRENRRGKNGPAPEQYEILAASVRRLISPYRSFYSFYSRSAAARLSADLGDTAEILYPYDRERLFRLTESRAAKKNVRSSRFLLSHARERFRSTFFVRVRAVIFINVTRSRVIRK